MLALGHFFVAVRFYHEFVESLFLLGLDGIVVFEHFTWIVVGGLASVEKSTHRTLAPVCVIVLKKKLVNSLVTSRKVGFRNVSFRTSLISVVVCWTYWVGRHASVPCPIFLDWIESISILLINSIQIEMAHLIIQARQRILRITIFP